MWKTCQEAGPKTEVMTADLERLTPLYPQRYLASFIARLDILIIGGNKENRPPIRSNNNQKQGPPRAAFSVSGGNFMAPSHRAQSSPWYLRHPPKGPRKVVHFHQHATVQNGPPRTPVGSGTCRSPIGEGGRGLAFLRSDHESHFCSLLPAPGSRPPAPSSQLWRLLNWT
jgi:hypothetical protein